MFDVFLSPKEGTLEERIDIERPECLGVILLEVSDLRPDKSEDHSKIRTGIRTGLITALAPLVSVEKTL